MTLARRFLSGFFCLILVVGLAPLALTESPAQAASDDAVATATGPISATPTNIADISLTYSFTGAPSSVDIYYTTDTGSPYTWILAGTDDTVDNFFDWTIPADGTYGWNAVAVGGGSTENPPLNTVQPEAQPYIYDGTQQTPQEVIGEIDAYIQALPDEAFKNDPDERRASFQDKLDELLGLIHEEEYEEAVDKLQHDIRAKMDGSLTPDYPRDDRNDWIIDETAQQDLCQMIDALIAHLETLQ